MTKTQAEEEALYKVVAYVTPNQKAWLDAPSCIVPVRIRHLLRKSLVVDSGLNIAGLHVEDNLARFGEWERAQKLLRMKDDRILELESKMSGMVAVVTDEDYKQVVEATRELAFTVQRFVGENKALKAQLKDMVSEGRANEVYGEFLRSEANLRQAINELEEARTSIKNLGRVLKAEMIYRNGLERELAEVKAAMVGTSVASKVGCSDDPH